MNKSKMFLLSIVLVFCIEFSLTLSSLAAGRGVTDDTIKIGMVLVKTGPVAALGLPEGWAITDTFNYANEQGGINGRKIKFIWEDDQFKTPNAIAKFKKLLFRDKVLFIVTPGGTPQTIALFDMINKYKVCTSPNGLAEEMYEPYKPYIFPHGCTYEDQIKIMFDYIFHDLKAKNPRIAIVYAETEFGKKGLYAARSRAKEYGIKLVSELVLNIGSVDASSQVLALKKENVDYVITCNLLPPAITFLKTAEKFNYWPITFGINWSTDDMLVKSCKSAAKNYIGVNFTGGWNDDSPGMAKARMLAKKYNRDPNKMLTSLYTGCVGKATMFLEGLKRAGRNLTPETLKAALETLKDFDTQGILPPITYTSQSHAPTKRSKLYKADIEKGSLIAITGWREPKELTN
ncbi:MAG: ABC transporter substrate-binding protein [Deltaproteobacteria bacterium]|nr:ABC transporter substrate-binding protein [Deltaproteobacteria bacterium]